MRFYLYNLEYSFLACKVASEAKPIMKFLSLILFLLMIPSNAELFAVIGRTRHDNIVTICNSTDTSKTSQKDIRDVFAKALHFKVKPDSVKLKGNGPFFTVFPTVGYSLQSGLTGVLTTSTSFYSSQQRNKLSNILTNAYYSQFHQFWIIANSNIFLEKLKLHLFGDWRYYKFPTHTYGIGSNSTFGDELDVDFSYVRFYQIVFREISDNVFTGFGYNLDYHWNINEMPASGSVYDEIHTFQNGNKSVSSGLSLNFLFDNRKNSINPTDGSLASIQYRPNFTFLGSDKNWQSLIIDLRHYTRFPEISRNIIAFWSYTNLTLSGDPPYFDLPSTGWDDYSNTGRGYVPGRYTGRNFIYAESEYRISLTRNGLFGCVAFCNAETVFNDFSHISDKIIPGGGFGIRIKINKYSNANLSIDYGFGIEGSRGFFFNLGEVF